MISVRRFLDPALRGWMAVCSCGWSTIRVSAQLRDQDADSHELQHVDSHELPERLEGSQGARPARDTAESPR